MILPASISSIGSTKKICRAQWGGKWPPFCETFFLQKSYGLIKYLLLLKGHEWADILKMPDGDGQRREDNKLLRRVMTYWKKPMIFYVGNTNFFLKLLASFHCYFIWKLSAVEFSRLLKSYALIKSIVFVPFSFEQENQQGSRVKCFNGNSIKIIW